MAPLEVCLPHYGMGYTLFMCVYRLMLISISLTARRSECVYTFRRLTASARPVRSNVCIESRPLFSIVSDGSTFGSSPHTKYIIFERRMDVYLAHRQGTDLIERLKGFCCIFPLRMTIFSHFFAHFRRKTPQNVAETDRKHHPIGSSALKNRRNASTRAPIRDKAMALACQKRPFHRRFDKVCTKSL